MYNKYYLANKQSTENPIIKIPFIVELCIK